jgi:hypothetical protein
MRHEHYVRFRLERSQNTAMTRATFSGDRTVGPDEWCSSKTVVGGVRQAVTPPYEYARLPVCERTTSGDRRAWRSEIMVANGKQGHLGTNGEATCDVRNRDRRSCSRAVHGATTLRLVMVHANASISNVAGLSLRASESQWRAGC